MQAEPPAMIDEQEASQIADVQHAGFIERTIGAMTDEATCYIDDDVKDVRICCTTQGAPSNCPAPVSRI